MLRETLKQEIEQLSESQLKRIAEFLAVVKAQVQEIAKKNRFGNAQHLESTP